MSTSCAGSAGWPAAGVLVISVYSPSQPGSIVRGMDSAPPRRPEHLDLRGQGLTDVPEWVWARRELETLNLSENRISSVSNDIAQLSGLRMLDLGHNELAELPEALGELVNLSDYLYLSFNHLTNFPAFLSHLNRLKYLNVTDNQLCDLPDAIGDMLGLRELRLYDNRLTQLPDTLGKLVNLRELHL